MFVFVAVALFYFPRQHASAQKNDGCVWCRLQRVPPDFQITWRKAVKMAARTEVADPSEERVHLGQNRCVQCRQGPFRVDKYEGTELKSDGLADH